MIVRRIEKEYVGLLLINENSPVQYLLSTSVIHAKNTNSHLVKKFINLVKLFRHPSSKITNSPILNWNACIVSISPGNCG